MHLKVIKKKAESSEMPYVSEKTLPTLPKKKQAADYLPKDWVPTEENVKVCPGTISQAHKKLKGRNEQGASICVMACAFASLRKMNTWSTQTLDEIIELGTKLHAKSRQMLEDRCTPHIGVPHVFKYFFLGNIEVNMKIELNVKKVKLVKRLTAGEKSELEENLETFFQNSNSGVVAFNTTYFAVWKHGSFFFMFDPKEHDAKGDRWKGILSYGYCYAKRFNEINKLAVTILRNVDLKTEKSFTIYPCSIEKMVKVNTKPPKTLNKEEPHPLDDVKPKIKKTEPKAVVNEVSNHTDLYKDKAAAPPEEKVINVKIEPKVPPPERPKLESATKFLELDEGRWGILRTITHQNDPKFSKYAGAQGFANAIAALTMLRVLKSKHWSKATVYDVLKLGETIHKDSLKLLPGEELAVVNLQDQTFHPVVKKAAGAVGCLTSTEDNILDLELALKNYFIDFDCGILVGPHIVAVWEEDDRFYMFDPNERDAAGRPVKSGEQGVACVTWFKNVKDLVAVYLSNVPVEKHRGRFVLCKVVIKDHVPKTDNWYNFQSLTTSRWILRGTFCQNDRRFSPETRNNQSTAIAVVVLAYKEMVGEKDWDSGVIDKVVTIGDTYYCECVEALKSKSLYKHPHLLVDEVKRIFELEGKRVNVEIDDCLVNGILNAKTDSAILNLHRGLEKFFSTSDGGIVSANDQSMAVWKSDNFFFYFDSHSRNHKGVSRVNGTACLLRLSDLENLTTFLLSNLGTSVQNFFNISRVIIKIIDVTDEGVIKPPLNNFEPVNDYVAILRASINFNNSRFGLNAGKQTVPMCLAALALNILIPSIDWTKEDIDQVLDFGNKLYYKSMVANYSQQLPEELDVDEITSGNVLKHINIGQNVIDIELEDYFTGNFEELKTVLEELNASLESEGSNKEDFQSIFESPYMTVSLWRDDNLYYLFDPKPRDEKGAIYGRDDWSLVPDITEYEETADEEEDMTAEMDEEDEDNPEEEDENKKEDENKEEAEDDKTNESKEDIKKVIPYDEGDNPDIEGNEETAEDEETKGDENETEGEETLTVEKKGSEFWRQKEEEGKSCLLRFSRIEDLIDHLLDNSPPSRRQELECSLKLVRLINKPYLHALPDPGAYNTAGAIWDEEWATNWHNFRFIDYGHYSLSARTIPLAGGTDPRVERGITYQLPRCLVALGFASLFSTTAFKTSTVDDIVLYGDRLYTAMQKPVKKRLKKDGLGEEEIEKVLAATEFAITDYARKFCIRDHLVTWTIKEEMIRGDCTSTDTSEVPNVESGLKDFFNDHNHYAILVCKNYAVALWKTNEVYCMFDPHPIGPSGYRSPWGDPTITASLNLETLATIYVKNLTHLGSNFFVIHCLDFEGGKCPRERQAKEEDKEVALLGGYAPVTLEKAILRGTKKLACDNFTHGVHKQSSAIAFAALGFSLAKKTQMWTGIFIDEILVVGEELYLDSVDKLGDKFNPWLDFVDIYNVNPDFQIGVIKVNCALRFGEERGLVDVKNESQVLNLRQGFERFFDENSHGILIVHRLILAVWEDEVEGEKYLYIFDPNPRGASGLPSHGGTACLMKFRNAAAAAHHVIACLVDVDKTKLGFVIVPVEVVVGKARSRVKKRKMKLGSKSLSPVCRKRKAVALKQKRLLKKMLRRRKNQFKDDMKKLKKAAKKMWYKLDKSLSILRGYKMAYEDRQCPVIYAAFVLINTSKDLDKWTPQDINRILEVGEQLYVDSVVAYKPQYTRLNLVNTLRRFKFQDLDVKLKVFKPVELKRAFDVENVLQVLDRIFISKNMCVVNYYNYLVLIYFSGGAFYLFDPNPRNYFGSRAKENRGSAVMMKFLDFSALVEKMVSNLTEPDEEVGNFALLFLEIEFATSLVSN